MIMVSQDKSIWWDKTHSKTVGVPISATTGGFALTNWAWDPEGDSRVPWFGMWVVPESYSFADFECEGAPPPAGLVRAAVAIKEVHRDADNSDPGAPPGSNGGGGGGGAGAASASPAPRASSQGQPGASPSSPTIVTSGAVAVAPQAMGALTLAIAVVAAALLRRGGEA